MRIAGLYHAPTAATSSTLTQNEQPDLLATRRS
jgi:hypothetical protein